MAESYDSCHPFHSPQRVTVLYDWTEQEFGPKRPQFTAHSTTQTGDNLWMWVSYSQFEYAVLSTPCFTHTCLLETVKPVARTFHGFHTTSCMHKHTTVWILKTQDKRFYFMYNSYCKSQRKLIIKVSLSYPYKYIICMGNLSKEKPFCDLDA